MRETIRANWPTTATVLRTWHTRLTRSRSESAYDIYWKDNHTHVDIYGYYPIGAPTDVNAYTFELQKDQSKAAENGVLGGYEQSDFLWGKAADVAPTERVIRLPLRHRMSSARVTLKEGTGFAKDEWLKLEKQVLVMNTRRTAEINLATGEVKATGEVAKTGTLSLPQGSGLPCHRGAADSGRRQGVVQHHGERHGLHVQAHRGNDVSFRQDAQFHHRGEQEDGKRRV